MPEITMPRLSDTMEEGVIASWLKQVGDPVARGEVIAEIETDKALMELEAYDDGVLEQILADAGARVPIGEPIALVGDGSGAARLTSAAAAEVPAGGSEVAAAASGTDTRTAATESVASEVGATASNTSDGQRLKSSPLARKIARERGVDLATVTGTGPGGRITRRDVESASSTTDSGTTVAPEAEAPTTAPVVASGDYDEIPLTRIQEVSAVRLTESKQQAPHIYLTSAIDVTDLLAFRVQVNATLESAGKGKVSVNDLLVKAVAATLRTDPSVNVSFAGDKLLRHRGIHLGIAVATPAGLLVPVIRDADRKSVSEIAAESREKAERARDRKLRAEEMSGGTFTISNLGMFGIEQFTAVINPPESAILAVGGASDELRLDDSGAVVSRKVLRVTLSADHRAIDGAVAAKFLQQFKALLENPLRIIT
ncbi:dihydrolipoamide acetyltransferase family protein [Nocardia macrotermitis]|uniref:Dihydrolipoamide acetyltransferase component of pyruvate dehydrogenase complex n=1 Tax=Nocardia macrotermitis TaxID=2585198 RepID=A0A7K0D4I9_9NOCA|nr:dihydrolipoamide acetyltransferase family protein [Nocardia macrotermitis]MQY20617.1 Dihydrolipoyllysine-residue succinyltransferase component of 2-oxoglutarate dehydrogenase complex [Nocardia macrotermitis]